MNEFEQVLARVAEGGDEGDLRALEAGGVEAVRVVLRAAERGTPERGDFRDWDADLGELLRRIAVVDPTPLLQHLEESPAHVRMLLWALGGLEDERVVAALLGALSHRKADIRWVAVRGLASNRSQSVVAALGDVMLRDRSRKVRFAAMEAVASSDDPTVLAVLEEFLEHRARLPGEVQITTEAIERILRKT